MLRKLLFTLVIAISSVMSLNAQVGQGSIKGVITDSDTGEPIPFANVTLMNGSDQVIGTTTDFDGKYTLKPIPPGTYDLQISYVGYQTKRIAGITVSSDKITKQNVKLSSGIELEAVEIIEYKKPLIELDKTTSEETKTREEIERMAVRSAVDVAKTAGNGVVSRDDGTDDMNMRGGRSSNNVVFIDGIKINGGSTALPKSAIEEVTVKTGGLSAQYGDVTGGVTSITTRGALKEYFGNVEVLTSGFKASEGNVVGLDNFGYNLFGFSAGGPIITKKDENGKIKDAPLGFLVTGEYRTILNPRPSAVQLYKPTDAAQDEIHADPLFTDGVNPGVFKKAEFLTEEDFEEIDYQRNVAAKRAVLNGKFDIKVNELAALAVGGTFDRAVSNQDVRSQRGAFQLYNYANNPQQITNDVRAYVRYTQRFANAEVKEGEEDNSLVKNAFFSLQADFSRRTFVYQDENHEDNFFNYGYVGKFEAVTEPSYSFETNNGRGILLDDGRYYIGDFLTAFNSPIAYNYTPGNVNPLLANYTSSFYKYRDQFPEFYDTREDVEGFGGLVNGSTIPNNVYNLWSHPGSVIDFYQKSERDQYRLSGMGSADIGDHAIMLGFEYEQRVSSVYSLQPMGLWQLGRGTVNNHISEIDSSNYTIVQASSYPEITFERAYAGNARTYFAYNMRRALGLDPNGTDFIDFDSYDPSVYKMEYFAAEQLINPANNVNLQYRGYDYLGNKYSDQPSLDDFFNEVNELGYKTRPVAAYQPIYIAGFIEDKFAFNDLVFRLGLRLDRFDANQPVLKDQLSFFPTRDVAYAKGQGLSNVPSNIGDDYVVYVSDIENPNAEEVVGYRDPETNTFYNSSGEELNDPTILQAGSSIAPWLENPSARNTVDDMDATSFEDYEPQYTLMPRISFSFPISDEATFFANYDILAQRPTSNVALDPIDIIYIQNHNRLLSNPSLKPTKTISYELGFKQKLTNSSALTLSAFYREQRDEIQVVRMVGAFPEDYLTYSNQDFGTVKGFTINYDLRRVKNVMLRINYTLQFAEGTGSGATSSFNLVNSGQPNLRTIFPYSYDQRHQISATIDYRFARGSRYNGPKVGGKNILEDAGLNLTFIAGSGSPYTARSGANNSENIGGGQFRAPVVGDVNGSRLPWALRVNARVDKNFTIKWGEANEANKESWENGKKTSNLNVYVQVLNLLDRDNVQGVYAYTGNADDDGYLTSLAFQDQIRQQNNEQSFRDHYEMRLQNMYNYELPRRIRLGVTLSF